MKAILTVGMITLPLAFFGFFSECADARPPSREQSEILREMDRQRRELDAMRREIEYANQRELNRRRSEERRAALERQAEMERQRAETERMARRARVAEIERSLADLENLMARGSRLNDNQVRWVRESGTYGKSNPWSEFAPFVPRLYALYNKEKAIRDAGK